MELSKIKVGKRVAYRARASEGKGRVSDIQEKLTGVWVTVLDPTNNRFVTVRPSQLSAA